LSFFVGDITKVVGLGFQVAHIHQARGPNPKRQFLFLFLTLWKPAYNIFGLRFRP